MGAEITLFAVRQPLRKLDTHGGLRGLRPMNTDTPKLTHRALTVRKFNDRFGYTFPDDALRYSLEPMLAFAKFRGAYDLVRELEEILKAMDNQ